MQRCLSVLVLGVVITGTLSAADWPQWRGPERTGRSQDTKLLPEWPEGGPPLRWKAADLGTGYSSPSIAQGKVLLQTTADGAEFALALDEATGHSIWRVAIGKVGQNRGPQYPGTRSTPTVDGDRVYCLASAGELVCLSLADGKTHWKKHLTDDFDGKMGSWAYSESVLIDGDRLICTPGGTEATLVALNKLTGETVWKSAVPGDDNADYASIMVVGSGDKKQYVQFLRKGLVGVNAETGKFLWRYDRTIDQGANILTPIVVGERVFSAGSRTGGGLVELKRDGDQVTAKEVYFERTMSPGIGGAVLVDGNLYGTSSQAMFCADFSTGKIKWAERALGPSSVAYADGRIYVRAHASGDVAIVEPSPEGYREKGRFKQPDRSEIQAWPHPVIANGGLYLRDQGTLFCYNVAKTDK